jgi:NADPH:quinone reductase-like Zn-dependent oxidoreductase
MRAAYYEKYGSADVVSVREIKRPEPADNEVLVQVYASSVTTADWRFRASAFPAYAWLIGRMMAGLFKPRQNVLGSEFSGRVVARGKDVTRFKLGDEVFGLSMAFGAHAEYLAVSDDAAIVRKPANAGYDEAAGVPFGAMSALVFLRDFAKVRKGEKVLIVGASGGVGVHAVQLAKHFGAEVTAVASTGKLELVRSLGADHVIDYRKDDFTRSGQSWDVILDPVGRTSFRKARRVLRPGGRHVFLEFGSTEILQSLVTSMIGNRKVVIGISGDKREDLEQIAALMASGRLRGVIDGHYPLERIADAHARVETRHKTGSVIVTVGEPAALPLAAE